MLDRKIHSSKQLEKEKWSNGGQPTVTRCKLTDSP